MHGIIDPMPETASVIWYTGADGAVRRRNPSWEQFTGQSHADYHGWGWLDAIHPDDRNRVAQAWRDAVADGTLDRLRYRLRRHDGQWRDVTAHGSPLLEDGRPPEWVGICVDITHSLQAERALKASEERLRFLDRLGQAARPLTDANRVMATTARLLGEYLGATRCAYADVEADSNRFTIRSDWSVPGVPSSAGVYSLDLFGPQATSNLRRGQHLVVRDVDRELGDEGGGRMFNAIGIKAIICAGLAKDGRLVAMMAVHQSQPRNWTRAELALVEEVVDRCWAHIERVRDSAMLREQDRRKDEFLATLAHELRNPLAPMRYAVAMMRMAKDGSVLPQAQEVIDRQVSHMARLIDDLLDLSRINRGLIQLQREPVRLATLLQRAVETARPGIEAARHRLELQLPPDSLMVDADPARVVQVIGNLLNNAAKYTPDGGHIRLAAWAAGRNAVLEVADNGIGIPPDQQGKLFQMFTQLHHTANRAQGGLGIGLSLVKTLVEMHGGSVRVDSAGLDEGSRFTVELPLAKAAVVPATPPAAATPSAPGPTRVLVVEDNRDGLETLLALLDVLGYEVAGAADGREGLAVARHFRPQAVLLDLGLPVMDGFEVARAMREDPALKDTYIVALTGWGADSDRQRTAQAGFDAHLTKPVALDTLEEMLARATQPAAGN
ncbi:PAS domain-containing hybrid sensor histidine kinase/response regulator [Ramlibacter tataouinensis]|uniref:histidine kinase n=1 Tax=Ramlibacter tataouinensis (strain ATCC BAA-407 / DSM 14655 / LMG 21543 / TTB310) TaxID=365046 RepID=F5Y0Y4_RAMTT|nr:ATP-binding protein [Ramlibacter tataouinensis]AEG92202.1 candidate histidine kinase, hybrid [Ramlibacter tataouinensis TTB310]